MITERNKKMLRKKEMTKETKKERRRGNKPGRVIRCVSQAEIGGFSLMLTDGHTDTRTDERTHGRTDGRTDPYPEKRLRLTKSF